MKMEKRLYLAAAYSSLLVFALSCGSQDFYRNERQETTASQNEEEGHRLAAHDLSFSRKRPDQQKSNDTKEEPSQTNGNGSSSKFQGLRLPKPINQAFQDGLDEEQVESLENSSIVSDMMEKYNGSLNCSPPTCHVGAGSPGTGGDGDVELRVELHVWCDSGSIPVLRAVGKIDPTLTNLVSSFNEEASLNGGQLPNKPKLTDYMAFQAAVQSSDIFCGCQ